jgi:5-methylphenazine-1-carboxylate 1-monooxygenase
VSLLGGSKADLTASKSNFRFANRPVGIKHFQGIHHRSVDVSLVDRDPVSTWTCGRVTLIGDAAHPMQPIGSQAGSQAILDARLLTAALIAISNPVEALQHYDATRRPVMNDITLRNRSFGPEAAMQLVEERAPNGFVRIEDVISRHELDSIANSFAAAAGLDVETVNNGLSFVRPSQGTAYQTPSA